MSNLLYTPEYAEKPPSTGMITPVIKPDFVLSVKNINVPKSSSASPKRPIGVAFKILCERAVYEPSAFFKRASFCLVKKKPGAIAFTRMPTFAKCTASHCVKFEIAAFAPLYAGILVRGVKAFIEEMLMIMPSFASAISLANTCVVKSVPVKFKSNTKRIPSGSKSKKVLRPSIARSPSS